MKLALRGEAIWVNSAGYPVYRLDNREIAGENLCVMNINEITLEQLLAQSEPATHSGIVNLWKSSDVHFLVVFSDQNEQRRGLVAVGPSHDYKSIEDLVGADIDGLQPTCLVATQITKQKRQRPAVSTRSIMPSAEPIDISVMAVGDQTPFLAAASINSSAMVTADVQRQSNLARESLQLHVEEQFAKLQQELAAIEKQKNDLAERERWVSDAENRLNSLTEKFMERDASLQRRELALQKKEKEYYAMRFETATNQRSAALAMTVNV